MAEKKNYNLLWMGLIIAGAIIIGALILSSNSNKSNQFTCPDGTIVSDYSLCNQQEEREEVVIVSTRTQEQYEGLLQMFNEQQELYTSSPETYAKPTAPGVMACYYDLNRNYPQSKKGPSCELSSTTQDTNQNYIFTCDCSFPK